VVVADLGDGVGGEVAELTGAESGAGEHLDDEPGAEVGVAAGGGHEAGGVTVVEELRQRLGTGRDVAVEDRVAVGGVGPVPLYESFGEDADGAQPLPLGVLVQRRRLGPSKGGEPHLVVLDVGSGDGGDDGDVGVVGEPASELAQRVVSHDDTRRSEDRGELHQVATHRRRQLRHSGRQLGPLPVGGAAGNPRLGNGLGGAHELTAWIAMSSAVSTSISSAARRYSPASQSLVRCR
jgi:hypothetical protein